MQTNFERIYARPVQAPMRLMRLEIKNVNEFLRLPPRSLSAPRRRRGNVTKKASLPHSQSSCKWDDARSCPRCPLLRRRLPSSHFFPLSVSFLPTFIRPVKSRIDLADIGRYSRFHLAQHLASNAIPSDCRFYQSNTTIVYNINENWMVTFNARVCGEYAGRLIK